MLEATDLVALVGEHVALRPKGREHVGLCPFHDDRTPSLAVVTHKADAFYKCFACGAAGNAIDFVMNFHRMGFGDALRYLAGRAGIELQDRFERREKSDGPTKDDLLRANAIALKFYRRMLADPADGALAREIIAARHIPPAMIDSFQLGFAPDRRDGIQSALKKLEAHATQTPGRDPPPALDAFVAAGVLRSGAYGLGDLLRNRIVFPICDELGRPIAFGGRKIRAEDEPKYLNSPESPLFHKGKSLYGLHLAKQAIIKSRVAIVTEGYTDVIACHEAGFTNVVATLGTALTREHARLLRRMCDTVVLLFDGDAAGLRAADRGVEVFFAEPIDVKVCALPDELDPDELLRLPEGPALFRAALDRSVDALAFLVRRFRADYAARQGLSGRQQALEALLRRLAELGFGALAGVRKRFVAASLADLTGLSEREILAAIPAVAVTANARASRDDPSAATAIDTANTPPSGADSSTPVTPVSRARREAERSLLALLLGHAELARATVDLDADGDRSTLPVTDACAPEFFDDPTHATLYRTWRALADSESAPTSAKLLAELAEPAHKVLASDLLVLAQRQQDHGTGPDRLTTQDRLRIAFTDLERLARRERLRRHDLPATDLASFASSPTEQRADSPCEEASERVLLDLAGAQARLQRRLDRGNDVTAIPRPSRG